MVRYSGSLRKIIRRLLGRKGVFAARNILSSMFYTLGIYEKPSRPDGVSAITLSYNEEDWIRYSLLSIKDFVDEFIVMDSSTDNTPNIVKELIEKERLNIRYYYVPPGNIAETRNRALELSRYKWILVWDPDFVLFDDSINTLREVIESLDPNKHYLVYWPWITICGDLCHVCSENPYHIEHWMYTYSSKTRYGYVDIFDSLYAPATLYRVHMINRPLGLHISARNPVRTAVRVIWYRYREIFDRSSEDRIELAKKLAMKDFGSDDLYEVGLRIIREEIKRLPLYREEIYGRYPLLLRDQYLKCFERYTR